MIRPEALCTGVGQLFTAREAGASTYREPCSALPSTLTLNFMQMGKDMPVANDEVFGIDKAENTTSWCNFAMLRADHVARRSSRLKAGASRKRFWT